MGIEKVRILGNDFVGAWAIATDRFFLLGREVSVGEEKIIGEAIGVDGVRATVNGSSLIGIYAAANSNCILVPGDTEERELMALRQELPNTRIELFQTEYNALKNNILVNDKIAIINPGYSREEEKKIGDALGVETIRHAVDGFSTVGANNILTNKGLVLNNKATDAERANIEGLLKMRAEQSTANMGSVSIGLCAIANSKGLVAGHATTGFELARIAEALNL